MLRTSWLEQQVAQMQREAQSAIKDAERRADTAEAQARRLDHCVEVIGQLGNVAIRRTIRTPTAGAVIGQHGRK
jgi:hypothetical protein